MKLTVSFMLSLSFCAGLAVAQILSQCATACVSQAAVKDGCVSFTNITCVCTSAQFQQDALSCLTAECSSSDLTTLEGLQAQECGASECPILVFADVQHVYLRSYDFPYT
ncbi:uncharacterized protein C8R40DRAFT_418637 [Lentinula edodes]|uniref:uncharacterized protein n=1 Tax=Lentinula edodes TaxID=5353 RepID=UPI001E8DD32B|nr:uncharacterized protein C8R40DRAFT_418637 [Lentinula edodes]KAH7872774.1 hypothetical protein C8R40DRAFT_418637 [Lentinula edodes]